MGNLTIKQEAFCLAFLETGNASEAYRRAYNAEKMKAETVNRNAAAMRKNNKIATRIGELRAATVQYGVMAAVEALVEVSRLARFDVRKLYRADGSPIPVQDLDEDTARCLAGVDIHEEYVGSGENRTFVGYTKKYKTHDKNAALEKLFKHHGLYERDNHQRPDSLAEFIRSLSGNILGPVRESDDNTTGIGP